jgi:hypothetical protein
VPMAVPAIAAYAASAYATTAGFTIGALSVATSAAIVGAAAGIAASTAMSALTKPSTPGSAVNFDAGGGARTFQVRQPTAPHDVVVGRVKKSGTVVFMHSMADDAGRADGYFYMQLALAAHPCELIADVYIHDEISTAAKFAGFVRFGKNLGAVDQLPDADFLAELGEIFAGHRGQGIANLAARLKGNAAAFPNGLPNLSTIVWGVNTIYDPRSGTYGWTNNAPLVYAWWKTWEHGQKCEWADIDLDTLIDAANVADQRIRTTGTQFVVFDATANSARLAVGARAVDVGDGVRFTSSGTLPGGISADTTYYAIPDVDGEIQLAASVALAFARSPIDLTSAGTGQITMHHWDRAQWKCNGTFTLDQDKDSIRNQLLSSFMGFDVEVGGMWFIHAAAPALPTRTLDEDDLAGAMMTRPKRSSRDKFNAMRARFIDPSANWQPTDAPPWTSQQYVDEDNGIILWEEVEFPFTTDRAQVQQSMKLHLERNRHQRTVSMTTMFTAIPLRPLQGVYLSNERYGWEQEQHLVTGWTLSLPDFTVQLVLQEDSADIHAWTLADEIEMSALQDATLPDASSIPAPQSITVTTPALTYTQIEVTWGESLSAMLLEYETEYSPRDADTWTSIGKTGKDAARTMLIPTTAPIDVRVRAISSTNVVSEWRTSDAPNEPTLVSSPGDGQLQWTNPVADQIEIWRNGALHLTVDVTTAVQMQEGLSTGSYVLRAKNADGNVSEPTVAVEVSSGGG